MSAFHNRRKPPRVGDGPLVRRSLIAVVLILGAFLVLAPLVIIGVEAFSKGWQIYSSTIVHPDTRHAILLTVLGEWLRQFGDYRMILYSLLIIVLMIARPQGLFRWKTRNKAPA